jgi:heme/copper-type cytochrome/quinol oxidase subunit 3
MQQEATVGHVAAPDTHHADGHHDVSAFNLANSKLAMWLFLSSEVMFFTVLVGAYIIARFNFPEEHALLNIPLTSVASFILLFSSYTVVRAIDGLRTGNTKKLQRSLALNLATGAAFMTFMVYEYSVLSHEGVTISSSPFGFAFYALTGFHGTHVLIGLAWLVLVFNKSLNGEYSAQKPESVWGLEMYGLYWHFVDVVWIFIFAVVYLI